MTPHILILRRNNMKVYMKANAQINTTEEVKKKDMEFCHQCRTKIPKDAKFCSGCGIEISNTIRKTKNYLKGKVYDVDKETYDRIKQSCGTMKEMEKNYSDFYKSKVSQMQVTKEPVND